MHGIVLKGIKDFVVDQFDQDTWRAIQEEADVGGRIYVPVTEYPDEEVFSLVGAASELSGLDVPDILRTYGEYIVPGLVSTYGVHVDDDWDGIDLLANVEEYIHESLRRKRLSEFTPPNLGSERLDENRVRIDYGSDRELCELAVGIVHGVGDFYGEEYEVQHLQCMHDGYDHCELLVVRQPTPATDVGMGTEPAVTDD